MRPCNSLHLTAYLDGALDRESQERVEDHVLVCSACAEELHALRRSIGLLRTLPYQGLRRANLKKLHAAIDDEAADHAIWRLAGRLAALAASILVIASVWLMESPVTRPQSAVASKSIQPWEQLAMTLCVDPLAADDSVQFAVTTWMIESLFTDTNEGNDPS
jgi:anti-sigma factor RsiW